MKNFILLIVAVFFSILLAEAIFRVVGFVEGIDYTIYSKELRNPNRLPSGIFGMKSDTPFLIPGAQALAITSDFTVLYKINSKGLRDGEYDYKKNSKKIRIAAFGDSNTFGEGIPFGDRFTEIAETENIEIINFGVPGYGLSDELHLLEKEGIKYSPDYVIVFINTVDALRSVPDGNEILANKCDNDIPRTFFLLNASTFYKGIYLEKTSYFFSYMNYLLTINRLQKDLENYDKSLWECILSKTVKNGNTALEEKGGMLKLKESTVNIISGFDKIVSSNNKKNLIIINIDTEDNFEYLSNFSNTTSYYDFSQYLREYRVNHSLTFTYDKHYNKETHRVIGAHLSDLLTNLSIDR